MDAVLRIREVREVRAAAAGAIVVGAYMLLVLATGMIPISNFAKLLLFYLKASFSLWLLFGLVAMLVVVYRNRPRNGRPSDNPIAVIIAAGRERWERDRFASSLWPPLLFGTLIATFNAFKQIVLPAAGFHYDPLFAEVDRLLFFGTDPWVLTHAVLGSPDSTWFVDRAYHAWFLPMSFGVVACSWLPSSTYRLRNQYLLSYIAIWVGIGSVLAFLLPSAGPCYYGNFVGPSQTFAELGRNLAAAQAAAGVKLTALTNQAVLLRAFGGDSLVLGAGISAMPSVHNGLSVLFAIIAFQINRIAGWLVAAYAVLIWVGSIHLGWHYAIDGLAAAGLTWGIWLVAGRITKRLEGRLAPRGSEPALA